MRNARAFLIATTLLLVAAMRLCGAEPFVYDTSPTHVIFEISTRGGFESQLQELTALPDFVLYGDGTAVWVRHDKKKDLNVLMAARLSSEEVAAELAWVESMGFSGWYDRYDRVTLPKMPTTTVRLDLKSGTTTRMVYGLAMALKQKVVPEGFGQLYDHFTQFRHKDEYEYPIDKITLYARKLTKSEARRGYRSLSWGVKQVVLGDIAHDGDVDFGQKIFTGADAERVVSRLRNWTLFSTELSVVFFKDKKDDFQVGYRPVLPHE